MPIIRGAAKGFGMGAGMAGAQHLIGKLTGNNQQQGGFPGQQQNQCSACGNVNQGGQQFCGGCGNNMFAATPPAGGVTCSCGFVNEAGKKFCNSCGSPLAAPVATVTCACGQSNPPGTAFCGGCGSKLEIAEPKLCGGCGVEVTGKFCNACGTPA